MPFHQHHIAVTRIQRPQTTVRLAVATILCGSLGACVAASVGCHDGPLYGLKTINPYYSLKKWRDDEAIGVTDHTRRLQLEQLATSIDSMSAEKQAMWSSHLEQIFKHDPNAEMRRLTMVAAGRLSDSGRALEIIDMGLGDSVAKVRMEACRALGRRDGEDAARMLVAALSTDTDLDVRQSAITALAGHPGSIATSSLRRVLDNQNPATRLLAIGSLREITGRDLGDDPAEWIVMLDDAPGTLAEEKIASRPTEP